MVKLKNLPNSGVNRVNSMKLYRLKTQITILTKFIDGREMADQIKLMNGSISNQELAFIPINF